ncbi:unnamed protein product [Ixodes persulcatus]
MPWRTAPGNKIQILTQNYTVEPFRNLVTPSGSSTLKHRSIHQWQTYTNVIVFFTVQLFLYLFQFEWC